MSRWASLGISRVRHVLRDGGASLLTYPELCARHPTLAGSGPEREHVRSMYSTVTRDLHRWRRTLAAGPCPLVRTGQFRYSAGGALLRASQDGRQGQPTVAAAVCEVEPQTGAIRITAGTATLTVGNS